MSSNRPTEARTGGSLRRLRSPRGWSLQGRLLTTVVSLLAVVCVGIGVGTEIALHRFLMDQLDEQVRDAGRRSEGIFELGPPPPGFRRPSWPEAPNGAGPAFLNAPGQAAHMIGAVVSSGGAVDAGVITPSGTRQGVSTAAATQLAHI